MAFAVEPLSFFAPSGRENTNQVEIYIPFAFLGNIFQLCMSVIWFLFGGKDL